jgi:hypothetical protein
VFLHIHPHWLDATYLPAINQWDFPDLSKYRFENLNKQEQDFVFEVSN